MISKTVCNYAGCPFKDCDKHIASITESGYFIFENMAGTCRRYIAYLVDEAEKDQKRGAR